MPLAAAGVWFDSDTGDRPLMVRRTARADTGFAFPERLPVSEAQIVASFGGDNAIRRYRPRFQAEDNSATPWLLPVIWTPTILVPADSSTPWQRRPRPVAAVEGIVPIWTFGTGQPVPPLAWGPDSGAGLRRPNRFWPTQETALPPLLAVTDIPTTLIGWRDDPPAMRWRRPPFRADEITGLPPQAFFAEVFRYYAALIVPQPDFVRARSWRATAPDADISPIFQAVATTTDQLGRITWDVEQPRRMWSKRQLAWSDPGAWPVQDATLQQTPWLPVDGGDRFTPQRIVRFFAQADTMDGTWQAVPGLIQILGPYHVLAAQLWQPGAVDAQIESAD